MASQSLYRKWRSQTFSDLIGQEATTRTLLNAVREGRLAHAYLFCGPRGTGKTSAARLLAKAINCANPHNGEPCNECLSCREITEGRSPDVIEIDAASNTGVDNIRDLRENVNLLGTGGHFKVYIVDEVHMLSTAAFNALLKTLEEPPPHVIFVLATTEAHKVLPTIVSRCQRFDFRRFNVRTIVARLEQVAMGEGLELEPGAADLLARAAQGGMRDALSLLDQAMAYCGTRIDLDRTRAMLGLADPGAIRHLIVAVAEERPADALHQLNELVVNGADLRQLQQQLGEEWRALLLARAGADVAEVMDRTPDEARELASLAGRFSLDELMACARLFARSETPARGLPTPQLALELVLLECLAIHRNRGETPSLPRPAADFKAASPAAPAAPIAAPIAAPATPQPRPRRAEPVDATPVEERSAESSDMVEPKREATKTAAPGRAPQPLAPLAPMPSDAGAPEDGDGAEEEAEVEAAAGAEPSAPATPAGTDWLAAAQRDWAVIKKVCKQQSPSTAALLSHANPIRCEPGDPPALVVAAQYEFHYEKLKTQKARDAVEWALEQVLGTPMRARFILVGKEGGSTSGMAIGASSGVKAPSPGPSRATHTAHPRDESAPRPLPTRSPASASPAMNGAAPIGNVSAGQHNGHASAPPSHLPPAAGNGRKPDPARLEDEVRADAVVQEIQRELGAHLLDVQPRDEHESG